jgi:hypothetical protein
LAQVRAPKSVDKHKDTAAMVVAAELVAFQSQAYPHPRELMVMVAMAAAIITAISKNSTLQSRHFVLVVMAKL